MKFGTAEAAPGELATGTITLTSDPIGPLLSPVMLARGALPGPRLYIQCLIHGGENVGPIAAARFLRGLDLKTFKGSIAVLMCANPLGQRMHSRLIPQDGTNLNRIFPGSPSGSVGEQLADRLLALAGEHGGDAVLDLHSGGELTITAFYVIHDAKGSSPAQLASQKLSAQVGSRYQWGATEDWMEGTFLTNVTRRHNKAALIVESGGGARVRPEDLANFATALTGTAQALGMLPGTPPTASDIRYGGNAVHVKCSQGGYWDCRVEPGQDMAAGDVMGHMVDMTGQVVETITCPAKSAWVGSIRRPWMPLYAGDQVVEVVERK
ncbi:succinylglutamate desuccinylase/aspartoacylase family protein [Falsiroseomonas sp.]|uniref:succinylglutamate desuccinylase/aspartoacylase family protein n=1 Tax=Falsiroseomonas sp. TaxID=2870721 RepID=UPI003F70F211